MAGISSKAAGGLENKKKYNGIEFDNDLDLNTYEANLRDLDPQSGRWWQVDPKTDEMYMWSTYASNFDNPIRYQDPLGDAPDGDCCNGLWDNIKSSIADFSVHLEISAYNAAKSITNEVNTAIGNAKANWQTGNTIPQQFVQDAMENPMSLLDGGAELNAGERLLGMEVKETAQVTKNLKQGTNFEKIVTNDLKDAGHRNVAEQVTIKPNGASGKVRLDNVSTIDGKVALTDAKSSPTAPHTVNQKTGYPALEKSGGVVIGNKGAAQGYPAGTKIPPTKVDIIRPKPGQQIVN